MLDPTLPHTHYWPWDGDEQRAVCGAPMREDATRHSLTPSCPACAAFMTADDDAVDAAVETTTPPLDAADADQITDRLKSDLGAALFAFAVGLNRATAAKLRGGR